MANPQTEKGYSKIANEILDQLSRIKLNGTQFRIVLIVWRYTYGFSRKEHELSEGFIAKATNINRKQVARELRELIDWNVINVIKESTPYESRVISFNKNYEGWELISGQGTIKQTGSETVPTGGNQLAPRGGSGLVDLPGSGLAPQDNKVLKQYIYNDQPPHSLEVNLFDEFWNAYPRKVAKAAANRVFNKLKVNDEVLALMISALDKQKQSKQWQEPQFIPHATTWLNQRRWEDEEDLSSSNEVDMIIDADGVMQLR